MGYSIRYDGDTIGNITNKLLMSFFRYGGIPEHSNFNGEYYEYKFRGTLFSDNYIILYVFEKQLLVKHRNNLMNLRDYERIISTTCAQHHNLQLLETHRQTAFTWHRTCSGPSI